MIRQQRPTSGVAAPRRGRRLDAIVWLFAGIVVCLLSASLYSVSLLSGGRAFVGAEGVWTRSQNDAVIHLTRYAQRSRPGDLADFQRDIAVPLGARLAREALDKPEPDFARAREGFLQARAHPGDVDSMISLYRRFGQLGVNDHALNLWKRTDDRLDELAAIARELEARGADLQPDERVEYLERIERAGTSLRLLEDAFSATLGEAQRAAQTFLLSGLLVLAGTLLVAGSAISRRFVAHHERFQRDLRRSEAQLRNLVETAPMPLLILRGRDRRLIYANERALQQFSLDVDSARERRIDDLLADPAQQETIAEVLDRDGAVRDFEIRMRDPVGREFWQLLSLQRLRYTGEDCLLVALANIDDRKRVHDDMRRRAMHDPLTQLPNRANFMESLERAVRKARRRSSRFSVLFIDLDHFKAVNDTLGHHAGDELLRAVAERLSTAVRGSDLVARLAGDEFVVLIEEHGGPEEVMIVAQKVLSMLARPVLIDWREVAVPASIGIASFPEDGEDLETLVRNADAAMYQAKERGRNNFQFYSEDLNKVSEERVEQEKRVRAALENDEFFLCYQPEVDLATGRTVAIEALLRWRDPVEGVVMPSQFLPMAEETGSVIAIGRWVLDHALAELKAWRARGVEAILAVNLSPRQLQHPDLVNEIFRALQAYGIDPGALRLEIPESALIEASDVTHRTLRALRGLGVKLAIDDFGTGYSSLGLVRGLPVDVVKIDRSLVSACTSQRECAAIIEATAAMSRALGIHLVAEGVETEEQRVTMITLGCDAAHGQLFGSPVEGSFAEEATAVIAEH